MENPLWRNSKWVSKFIAMAISCLAAVWVVVPFLAESGMIDTWIGLILLYSTFNLTFLRGHHVGHFP